jgi:ADP-dependent NAD(P)H-hydrate dehydratase
MSNEPNTSPPLPRLPPRAPESHKGDFGRALLVGGSRGMSGAIALAGMATLRSGAGLVKLAVPDAVLDTVASFEPSYMTVALPCDRDGRITLAARAVIEPLIDVANCVACGPGLGRSDDLTELVVWMYSSIAQPLVLDADALNALATRPDVQANPGGPRVLTPHPGEFRRLIGDDTSTDDQLLVHAVEFSRRNGVVVVLKGHRTLITDGSRSVRNTTGNPGMATGGSGDVLTGIITALVCQQLSPFDAAQLGVHIHGLAGDLAAAELGQVSLIASDLVRYLPQAFLNLQS